MSNDRKGYVYILSNISMPGIVKIGRSKYGGKGRADTLYKNDTGVPTPFVLEFDCLVEDCVSLEKRLHSLFYFCRVNDSREFFQVPVKDVCAQAISVIAGDSHDHGDINRCIYSLISNCRKDNEWIYLTPPNIFRYDFDDMGWRYAEIIKEALGRDLVQILRNEKTQTKAIFPTKKGVNFFASLHVLLDQWQDCGELIRQKRGLGKYDHDPDMFFCWETCSFIDAYGNTRKLEIAA